MAAAGARWIEVRRVGRQGDARARGLDPLAGRRRLVAGHGLAPSSSRPKTSPEGSRHSEASPVTSSSAKHRLMIRPQSDNGTAADGLQFPGLSNTAFDLGVGRLGSDSRHGLSDQRRSRLRMRHPEARPLDKPPRSGCRHPSGLAVSL